MSLRSRQDPDLIQFRARWQSKVNDELVMFLRTQTKRKVITLTPREPIDLCGIETVRQVNANALSGEMWIQNTTFDKPCCVNVIGGFSSASAYPMNPDWVRGIRDQCARHQIPFNFIGWGSWIPMTPYDLEEFRNDMDDNMHLMMTNSGWWHDIALAFFIINDVIVKGHDKFSFEKDMPFDKRSVMRRVTHLSRSNRLLDGKEWIGMPEIAEMFSHEDFPGDHRY